MSGALAAIVAAFNSTSFLLAKCNDPPVDPVPCCDPCTWTYANSDGDFVVGGYGFTGGTCTCTFNSSYLRLGGSAGCLAFTVRADLYTAGDVVTIKTDCTTGAPTSTYTVPGGSQSLIVEFTFTVITTDGITHTERIWFKYDFSPTPDCATLANVTLDYLD
jgi:hypothetical protein